MNKFIESKKQEVEDKKKVLNSMRALEGKDEL
jgi:hypothetical protein